ncbi:hydroxyphenylacetyl-CoA thioesterase PaaI [Haloarchaeobius sp. DFWS5]|uniref:hydroxyphenylacetyl-CoA thioesterase PaaI n=1 Tax=Haloarchaeobius sp. DFWS5 TaxID=3446114 RepID=UPI003EBA7021
MSDESSDDADEIPDELREKIDADPFCDRLGIELVDLGAGTATLELTLAEDMCNFHGTPHGGVIYSLADAAFAASSNSHGTTAVALETNMSYLMAAEVGQTLRAEAEETHMAGRTAEYQIDITTVDDGERVATFRGRVYRFVD